MGLDEFWCCWIVWHVTLWNMETTCTVIVRMIRIMYCKKWCKYRSDCKVCIWNFMYRGNGCHPCGSICAQIALFTVLMDYIKKLFTHLEPYRWQVSHIVESTSKEKWKASAYFKPSGWNRMWAKRNSWAMNYRMREIFQPHMALSVSKTLVGEYQSNWINFMGGNER